MDKTQMLIIGGVCIGLCILFGFVIRPLVIRNLKAEQLAGSCMILTGGLGFGFLFFSTGEVIAMLIGIAIAAGSIWLIIAQWKSMIGKTDEQIELEMSGSMYTRGLKVTNAIPMENGMTRYLLTLVQSNDDFRYCIYCSNMPILEVNKIYCIDSRQIDEIAVISMCTIEGHDYQDISVLPPDIFKPATKFAEAVVKGALL